MGLLSKYPEKEGRFIKMYKSDSNAIFYRLAERPYTIAKVVFLDSNDKAIDFKARKLQYYIGQVPGFNIFLFMLDFTPLRTISLPTKK